MSYGVIVGPETMRHLDLDTSICDSKKGMGLKQIAVIPRDCWTNRCIQMQKNGLLKHPPKFPSPMDTEESVGTTRSPREAKATEVFQPNDLKKANLSKVAQNCKI